MPSGEAMRGQRGFTYLGVLFLVALMGGALAAAGQFWSTASQRDRERDLLWIGNQYAMALRSYHRNSPGNARYPQSLEELLEDRRQIKRQRHLRRLYADPVTGSREWGLIRSSDGRIAGVYSLSERRPLKSANFPPGWEGFEGMTRYADWQFVAEPSFRQE
ncbi:type II secretion system protein [Azotobacter sp. CWF10]